MKDLYVTEECTIPNAVDICTCDIMDGPPPPARSISQHALLFSFILPCSHTHSPKTYTETEFIYVTCGLPTKLLKPTRLQFTHTNTQPLHTNVIYVGLESYRTYLKFVLE